MTPKRCEDTNCTTISSSGGDGGSESGDEGMRQCHAMTEAHEGGTKVIITGPKDADDDGETEAGLPAGTEASRPQGPDSEIEEVSGFTLGSDHDPSAEATVCGRCDSEVHDRRVGEVQQGTSVASDSDGDDANGARKTGMAQSRTPDSGRNAEKSSSHPQEETVTYAVFEKKPSSDPTPIPEHPPASSSSQDASISASSASGGGVDDTRRGHAREVQQVGEVAEDSRRDNANDEDKGETETRAAAVSTEDSRKNAGESCQHQQEETDMNISSEKEPQSAPFPTLGQPQGQQVERRSSLQGAHRQGHHVERRLSLPGAHRITPSWAIDDRDIDDDGETEQPGSERLYPVMPSSSLQRDLENPPEDDAVPVSELATLHPCIEADLVLQDDIVEATPVNEVEGAMDETHRQKIESLKRGQKRACVLAAVVLVILASAAAIAVVKLSRLAGGDSPYEGKTAPVDDPDRMASMRAIVAPLSGDNAFDSNSLASSPDRIAALDWLVRTDPAQLPPDDPDIEWKIRQRYVMALFYISTNGPGWFEQYKFLSGRDECEWNRAESQEEEEFPLGSVEVEVKGVVCDLQGRVQMLKLWWNNLSGTLPHEISFLSESLIELNLPGGSISSTIPSSFGDLTNLSTFMLAEHCLSGTIPERISGMPRLKYARFEGNKDLTGSINGFCSGTDYKYSDTAYIGADCGDCPGSKALVECNCCQCCDSNSFDCCDKEGNLLWKYHNLGPNPVSGEPLSFDRSCLSSEALLWRQDECPCVAYEEDVNGRCTMDCAP